LSKWDGDGIIARIQNKKIASAVLATGLPVVDVLGFVPEANIPLVHVDDAAISKLAAKHLLERGFRSFGFCTTTETPWSKAREEAFTRIVAKAGYDCDVCQLPPYVQGRHTWEKLEERIMDWILSLPKPVGIMVCNDLRGQLVLEACRQANIAVPEEAAVIGVDNDESICEITDPPLSSVIPDHQRVGYEAAALLDRLMSGAEPPRKPIYTLPTGVAMRLSTDILAINDRYVAAAVRFIRKHACDGIGINDVLQHVRVSRSMLQRRFRKVLNRSIHDEILRIRLHRVKILLAQSDLPIETVTKKTGFSYRQHLGQIFKEKTGLTLSKFREKYRTPGNKQCLYDYPIKPI
jgi:LacI family transcriptional regulator